MYVQIVGGVRISSKQGCGLAHWNPHPALTRDKVSANTHHTLTLRLGNNLTQNIYIVHMYEFMKALLWCGRELS